MTDVTPERREILKRARAARTYAKHARWAAEMALAGWSPTPPGAQDEIMSALGTAQPAEIARVLRETGNEKYGADEMERVAEALAR